MNVSTSDRIAVAGRNAVLELLEHEPNRVEKLFVLQDSRARTIDTITRTARRSGVPVQHVPASRLKREAAGVSHQGVVAIIARSRYLDVDGLLQSVAPTRDEVLAKKPFLLMLDRIQDPHNFGAILRSAVAADVDGVIVPAKRMAPLNEVTVRVSAGTALRIPIARTEDLASLLTPLKERGYWIAASAMDGTITHWEMNWDRPTVLVIGSEGEGVSGKILRACDVRVRIPLSVNAESLNASVAAGILMFAAAETRMRT